MSKLKIVSIVPARSGSKSILNKNIVDLNEQPLISYTILDSLRVPSIEETYVSTDGEEIKEIAEKYGAEVPFLRPKEYATDTSTDLQWAWHFLDWFETNKGYLPELLVHLRPTTPIRDIRLIYKAIDKIKEFPEATSLISVEEFPESPYKWMKLGEDGYLISLFKEDYHLMPKQLVPKAYRPNGYVDVLRPEVILKGELHGENILAFITPVTPEIDSWDDLEYCKFLLNKNERMQNLP
jgi:N-acylneuraminate cytidylyltransferase